MLAFVVVVFSLANLLFERPNYHRSPSGQRVNGKPIESFKTTKRPLLHPHVTPQLVIN